ncbi:hypothetical protein [Mycobacterium sp. NPDC006124]|uniref:hypothetical protein n=1 Tax=Mycobacterium sp. NPDC006124 TaxID=3156729 RepID=UPI0033BEED05
MQAAVRRPNLSAGVALVGASVIAAAAAVTPMPEIHLPDIALPSVHATTVDLAALANPLDAYAQVFQTALANTNTLVQNTIPGQLLNQILQNQVGSAASLLNGLSSAGGGIAAAASQVPAVLATAVSQLAAGNVEGAVNSLLSVPLTVAAPALNLLPVLQGILTKPLTNLVNVVNAFTADPLATLLAVSGFIAPLISVPGAAAAAIQNVINAVGTGDLGAVANAVLTAPATIADGLLNGGYGPDLGPIAGIPAGSGIVVKAGGLLASSSSSFDADGNFVINTGGPLYALQQVLKMITDAIAPQAPAPVSAIAAVPAATATLVTTAAPAATTDTEAAAPATAKPAESTDGSTPAKGVEQSTSPVKETAPETASDATPSDATAAAGTTAPAKTTPATAAPSQTTAPVKATPAKTGASEASGADVTTGNKVEPTTKAGTDAPKSGGSSAATPEKETASAASATGSAASADKGESKGNAA